MSYFLSLVDQVAPLIDIIVQIFIDMKWFMVVLLIYILMFAQCFQIMSHSQVDFDNLTADEEKAIPYMSTGSSFWYAIKMMFGGSSNEYFTYGEAKHQNILEGLFFAGNFIIILHFLNMLIAIMGGTYGNREAFGT